MDHELHLSKLDAARRQLETAIRLYFCHGDPVSIHTLTAAAYAIIRDINNHRGGEPMFAKEKLLQLVKPEFEKLMIGKLNAAENFFKHADRDHSETLPFKPRQTEYLLIDACSKYFELTGEDPPIFWTYRTWFVANHSDLFKIPNDQAVQIRMNATSIVEMGRRGFFDVMLPTASRLQASPKQGAHTP